MLQPLLIPLRRVVHVGYFWVQDGSDKVTIVKNKHLKRTLKDYRRKVHGEEKQPGERYRPQYEERREEYVEDEEVQQHTQLRQTFLVK